MVTRRGDPTFLVYATRQDAQDAVDFLNDMHREDVPANAVVEVPVLRRGR